MMLDLVTALGEGLIRVDYTVLYIHSSPVQKSEVMLVFPYQ